MNLVSQAIDNYHTSFINIKSDTFNVRDTMIFKERKRYNNGRIDTIYRNGKGRSK
jgi:hypothetical protein